MRAICARDKITLVLLALVHQIFDRLFICDPIFKQYVDLVHNQDFLVPEDLGGLQTCEMFSYITEEIEKTNLTCKLWSQYIRMILLIQDFIVAEKTGDW